MVGCLSGCLLDLLYAVLHSCRGFTSSFDVLSTGTIGSQTHPNMLKHAVTSGTAGMYETCDVLVESVVATWNERLGAARLLSPATSALVDGLQGPVAARGDSDTT